jgi:hypothetical protein
MKNLIKKIFHAFTTSVFEGTEEEIYNKSKIRMNTTIIVFAIFFGIIIIAIL